MWDDTRGSQEPQRNDSQDRAEAFEEIHYLSIHGSNDVRICRSPKAIWLIQLEDDTEEEYFDDGDLEKAIQLSLESGDDSVTEGGAIMTNVTSSFPIRDEKELSCVPSNNGPSRASSRCATQDQPSTRFFVDVESTVSPSNDEEKRIDKLKVVEDDHIPSSSRNKGKGKARDLEDGPNFVGLSTRIAALFEPQTMPEEDTAENTLEKTSAAKVTLELDNSALTRERRLLGDKFYSGEAQINPDKPRGCGTCLEVPVLPERSNRFKVVLSERTHFVAVSYCWPRLPCEATPTYSYRRVLEDGTSQECTAKPPDEVMDRAIAFARACDIRQIWIDKICTSSDRDDDQYQFDPQANASVFRREYACIGLLDSMLSEKRLVSSLARAIELEINDTFPRDITQICQDVLVFLTMLAFDRFNERAWTLQECFSGRQTLAFALRTAPGVSFSEHAIGNVAIPQAVTDSFLFTYDELFAFIKCFKRLLTAYSPYEIGIVPGLVVPTLGKLEELYLEVPQSPENADKMLSAASQLHT